MAQLGEKVRCFIFDLNFNAVPLEPKKKKNNRVIDTCNRLFFKHTAQQCMTAVKCSVLDSPL